MSDNPGGPLGPRDHPPDRRRREKTPRESRQAPKEPRLEAPGPSSGSGRAEVRRADRSTDIMKNDLNSLRLVVDQLQKDVARLKIENRMRDENAMTRYHNARAGPLGAQLKPLMSYETGRILSYPLATPSAIQALDSGKADEILRQLGLSVASNDVKEKRRTLMLAHGVTHLFV